MNRYWLISELFYPDEVSTGYIMTEMAESLATKHQIDVICGPSGYGHTEGKGSRQLSKKIRIHRVKLPAFDKNRLVSRLLRMLLLTLAMGWKAIRKVRSGEQVVLVTNPAFLLLLFGFIRKFKRFKYTLIVHDVFPENMVPAGLAKETSFLYKLLLKGYNAAYNAADHLVVLGEDMKELISRKVEQNKKISIIPNWADLDEIEPIANFDKNAYLGCDVKDKIVIGFAGNIGRAQGMEEFIKSYIKAANPHLVLSIIGNGAMKAWLEQYVKEKGSTSIYFLGNKPRGEQIQFLNACDIGLVSLRKGMYGLGVPSKTYNIMAAGKPVLFVGDLGAEVSLYISQYGCGWAFDWSDEKSLVQFLAGLSVWDGEIIRQKGLKALHAAKENFSKKKILKQFQQVLESV